MKKVFLILSIIIAFSGYGDEVLGQETEKKGEDVFFWEEIGEVQISRRQNIELDLTDLLKGAGTYELYFELENPENLLVKRSELRINGHLRVGAIKSTDKPMHFLIEIKDENIDSCNILLDIKNKNRFKISGKTFFGKKL